MIVYLGFVHLDQARPATYLCIKTRGQLAASFLSVSG